MNEEPITVTYSLETILARLEQKIDTLQGDITDIKISQARLEERLSGDIKTLEEKIEGTSKALEEKIERTSKVLEEKMDGTSKTLEEKIEGISKRLDYQEFINRGVVLGLILAIMGGLAKLFGIVGNP